MKTIRIMNEHGDPVRINANEFDPEIHERADGEPQTGEQLFIKEADGRFYVITPDGQNAEGFGAGGYASHDNAKTAIAKKREADDE